MEPRYAKGVALGATEPSIQLREGKSSRAVSSLRLHSALERCVWLVCSCATILAVYLLRRFEVEVAYSSLLVAIAVFGFLVAVYIVYGRWRASPRLSNLCGALAAMTWSAAMAGIISLVGLRYRLPLIDDHLARMDRAVGLDLPAIVAWTANNPFWSRLLAIAYDSSFPVLFGLTALLAFIRRYDQLWLLAFVFAATIVASTSISVVLPARGAFAFFEYSAEILDRLPPGAGVYHLQKFDYYRDSASPMISFASLQGVVTFPSFHCCLALMTIFATRSLSWLFPISLTWNGLVIVSTLPMGGHYAIDLTAGFLLWLGITVAAITMSGPWSVAAYSALSSAR